MQKNIVRLKRTVSDYFFSFTKTFYIIAMNTECKWHSTLKLRKSFKGKSLISYNHKVFEITHLITVCFVKTYFNLTPSLEKITVLSNVKSLSEYTQPLILLERFHKGRTESLRMICVKLHWKNEKKIQVSHQPYHTWITLLREIIFLLSKTGPKRTMLLVNHLKSSRIIFFE